MGIPAIQKIRLSEQIRAQQAWCKQKWNDTIQPRLSARSPQPKLSRDELRGYTESMLRERLAEAEALLPMPVQRKVGQLADLATALQSEF